MRRYLSIVTAATIQILDSRKIKKNGKKKKE